MINYPAALIELFEQGRVAVVGLIRFDFGTGTYGFARSDEPVTYQELTYLPGGALKVSDLTSRTGLYAQKFTITLAASPDDGLTPAVLQTIENEDYRDRQVRIFDAYYHPDTNELLHVQLMKKGYVDTIDHDDDPRSGYKLVMNCETRSLDYTRTNSRKRNDTDQQRRAPGDKFLEHASKRGREEIFWGRKRNG